MPFAWGTPSPFPPPPRTLGVRPSPAPWRAPMTPLRQRFIDDLRLRNYAPRTIETYVGRIVAFARHFGRSPELLGPEEVRAFQLHLLERRVSWSSFNQAVCALRFLYGTTLGRPEHLPMIPYGKRPQ